MRPMLAVDHDPNKLPFPHYASPKLDGLRGLIDETKVLSRSLKLIPNAYVQNQIGYSDFHGLDGELIAGSPTAPNCMQACTSFFMAHDKVSDDWAYHVFDLHNSIHGYDRRYDALSEIVSEANHPRIILHSRKLIKNMDELLEYETEQLTLGYEGLILRSIDGRYKFGRSTVNEGLLLKVKRFTDSEALIIGFVEQMENTNEKQTNELGRSKRSSHKAGLVGKNTLGAFLMRDLYSGVEFSCGTGMDDAFRQHVWNNQGSYLNEIGKYKSFLVGVKDLPRHPVWGGIRDRRDMS